MEENYVFFMTLKPKWFTHWGKLKTHFMLIYLTQLLYGLSIISWCLSYNEVDCFGKEMVKTDTKCMNYLFEDFLLYFRVKQSASEWNSLSYLQFVWFDFRLHIFKGNKQTDKKHWWGGCLRLKMYSYNSKNIHKILSICCICESTINPPSGDPQHCTF